ncbi:restriction endonuclease subunit S [Pseudanabaena sp. Chao 1811]|uniref:restriction endonuclease subunit S n=1 Tax=Pseudanabaena sp. Chao 1811 TaxID=2963092 RepID=UPI0022F3FA4F|nr:restriction endonuclease subunit S [Pseudanabaena sp. Chao 1811]
MLLLYYLIPQWTVLNQKLEETAQAIYKQWFVDFEFPDEDGKPYKSNGGEMVESELGEIPKGWEVTKLENLIEVKYGKDYKHLQNGQIPLYGSGGIMGYVDKYLYDKQTILIPRKGSLNNILFVNKPFWSVDTMFYSIVKNLYSGCYVYYYLKSINFNSLDVGSAVPSMTTAYLNNMIIIKPAKDILKIYDCHLNKVIKLIECEIEQNQKLNILKNLLLSKLATMEN